MEKRSMTSRRVNNEVDFCKVYDMGTKEKIEKILLANRISYCCHFEDKGILNRIFPSSLTGLSSKANTTLPEYAS